MSEAGISANPDHRGILLVNLGTPDSPAVADVRRYLHEFLSDPLVIDLPAPLRFLLVRGLILPFRPKRAAAAYEKIWTDRGSPLRFHGEDLAVEVARVSGRPAALGMRYGNPSIAAALNQLAAAGATTVQAVPLFPQYSESAWETAAQVITKAAAERRLRLAILPPFYATEEFLLTLATHVEEQTAEFAADHYLMSFHGLPERHMRRTDQSREGHCLTRPDCCDALVAANQKCYRAQCYRTARELGRRLDLPEDRFSVSFQSRLGRTPWIQPFTDERIPELAKSGCRRLAVLCPAFVADCLETLEEVAIRERASFLASGGEELLLVKALNSDPRWARAIVAMLEQQPD